jgi:hypothetical protein
MDLSKMINLIAEVAVKRIAQERSQNQTKTDAVLTRRGRGLVIAQAILGISFSASDMPHPSF